MQTMSSGENVKNDKSGSLGVITALPMISMETTGPREINVSKVARFNIVVANLGDTLAKDFVVEAVLPEKAKLTQSRPAAETNGGHSIRFPVADLEAGGKREYVVELEPQESGHLDLATQVSFATKSDTRTLVRQPALELAYQGPEEAEVGKSTPFRLIVTNTGDGPAEDLYIKQESPNGEAGTESKERSFKIEQLRPGESRELSTSILPRQACTLDLRFVATASGDLKAECQTQMRVRSPKLQLEVRGPKVAYMRRQANYELVLRNEGDAAAANVQVTIALPPGLRIAEANGSADLDKNRNSLTWALSELATDGEQLLSFKTDVVQEGEQAQQIVARWTAGEPLEIEHVTKVVSRPDLTLNLDYNDGQIEVGDTESFDVLVKNRGTNVARDVAVRITLPDGLESVESPEYVTSGTELSFPAFSLSAGEERLLQFQATGRLEGDHVVGVHLGAEELAREVLREESIFCFES